MGNFSLALGSCMIFQEVKADLPRMSSEFQVPKSENLNLRSNKYSTGSDLSDLPNSCRKS